MAGATVAADIAQQPTLIPAGWREDPNKNVKPISKRNLKKKKLMRFKEWIENND